MYMPFEILCQYPSSVLYALVKTLKIRNNNTLPKEIFLDRSPSVYSLVIRSLDDLKPTIIHKEQTHLKRQLFKEATQLFLEPISQYFDPLRYPMEDIGEENIKMRSFEELLRKYFATNRDNPILEVPYLNLINIYESDQVLRTFKPSECNPMEDLSSVFNLENPSEAFKFTHHTFMSKQQSVTLSHLLDTNNPYDMKLIVEKSWYKRLLPPIPNYLCFQATIYGSVYHLY